MAKYVVQFGCGSNQKSLLGIKNIHVLIGKKLLHTQGHIFIDWQLFSGNSIKGVFVFPSFWLQVTFLISCVSVKHYIQSEYLKQDTDALQQRSAEIQVQVG